MMLSAAALLATGWLAAPVAAQEQPRSASTEVTTDRGTATVTRSSSAGDDGRSGTVAIQGANGRTATRDFARRYVRGEGVTAQSTLTGADGRSRTAVREAARVGPRTIGRSRQITGPRGETRPQRRWVRVRSPR
jgi:hypothetical protein